MGGSDVRRSAGLFARCVDMVLTDMLLSGSSCAIMFGLPILRASPELLLPPPIRSSCRLHNSLAGGLIRKLWSVPHLRAHCRCTVVRVWSGPDAVCATLRFRDAESADCGSTAVQVQRSRKAGL